MTDNVQPCESVLIRDESGIASGGTVGLDRPMNRDIWLREVFPDWKSFLNREIENFEVAPGTGAVWFCGGPSYILKSQAGAIMTMDLYTGGSLWTDPSFCGVCRQTGADRFYVLRIMPHTIDPWDFKRWDAVFVSHQHQDHMDFYTIKAALQTSNATFVAPPFSAQRMRNMGVPESRLVVAEWGKSVQIEDMVVEFAPNFDQTAVRTGSDTPMEFKEVAVTYVFKTQGGNIAFFEDSIYHNGYKAVGELYQIDVMSVGWGHNAVGCSDKASPWDVWRLAEATKAKVVLPCHTDIFTSFQADPDMVEYIIDKESRGTVKVVQLLPGARYIHPDDQNIGRYRYPDGSHRMDWRRSWEYGHGSPSAPQGIL